MPRFKTIINEKKSTKTSTLKNNFDLNTVQRNWLYDNHLSMSSFPNKNDFMWTSTYEANSPSEDHHASLVNMLLTTREEQEEDNYFIRMSMWCVLDGHGGGAVATYASQALLPHIAVNISRALEAQITSKGEFTVDGELQDVEVLDFEDILRGQHNKTSSLIDKYISKRNKRRRTDKSSGDLSKNDVAKLVRATSTEYGASYQSPELIFENQNFHRISDDSDTSEDDDVMAPKYQEFVAPQKFSGSNVPETSSATKVGTHSKKEVDAVRRAINDSFLELDESWINSIDPENLQKSCVHGGQWNVGSCALVTCIIQRINVESILNSHQCPPKKRKASSIENAENKVNVHAHDAMLYTAHCGDCRAVLGVHRPDSDDKISYDSAISDSETDDCSFSSNDEDEYCSSDDSLSSDDEDLNFKEFSSRQSVKRKLKSSIIRSTKYLRCRPGFHSNSTELEYATDSTTSSYRKHKPNRFPSKLRSIDLTTDHTPYNPNEVDLVLRRCRNDPLAISSAINGGIKRVAGTLAITRALGDAYLKTPRFSFPPYKRYAPYISAMPEISNRILTRSENGTISDRVLIMGSDGLWDQASGSDVVKWVQSFCANKRKCQGQSSFITESSYINRFQRWNNSDEVKYCSKSTTQTSSDYIIQCALKKIVRSKKISSLRSLMSLKKGRARRSKHDDITTSVIDLSGFVV